MAGTGDSNGGLTVASAKAATNTITGITKSSIGDASHYPPDEQAIIRKMKENKEFNVSINRNKTDNMSTLNNITFIQHNNMTYKCKNDKLSEKELELDLNNNDEIRSNKQDNKDEIGLSREYISGASGDPPPSYNTLLQCELQLREQSERLVKEEMQLLEETKRYQEQHQQSEEHRESEQEMNDEASMKPLTLRKEQIIKDNNIWYKNQGVS